MESQQMYKHCLKNLKAQEMYAESIIVNGRTGKLVKAKDNKAASASKVTSFKKYQDSLFSRTSNANIVRVLDMSKKMQLSTMKESFGIKRYIQKKFLAKLFKFDLKTNDYIIQPGTLKEIKDEYFKEVIEGYGSTLSSQDKKYFFDQLREVDSAAVQIRDRMAQKVKDAKVDTYMFDKETFVAPNMINKDAIERAKEEARIKPNVSQGRINDLSTN